MVPNKKYLKTEFVERTDSKQTITTYFPNKSFATVLPKFSFTAVMELVDKDPVARGALNHFVDKCLEGDFVILKKKTLEYDKEFQQKLLYDHDFRTGFLRKVFLIGKMYQNVFAEIVRNGDGSLKELNVLDPSSVEAITKPNGDLLRLRGTIPDPTTGQHPYWEESEIVWFKFNDRTQGYAPVDMQSLWETLLIKDYIRKYVAWLWKTGQYRVLYAFKAASDQDINNFIAYAKKIDQNFQAPMILKGELDIKMLRDIKETDGIERLLKYWDNQTLIAMRVPPNDAGIPDASGRSNADAQTNNLATTVTSMKTVIADTINTRLFPAISKGNNILRFSPLDRFAEKQVFEVLQLMQSLGFSHDAMQEYLTDKGMVFATDKLFNETFDVTANPRAKDMAPSRLGKGTGEGNKPAEDGPTTRPDQLKKE